MDFKEIVDSIAKLLPQPLRPHFVIGVVSVAAVGGITKFVVGFEWLDVFRHWLFYLAMCGVCVYWIIVLVKRRQDLLWHPKVFWLPTILLALLAFFAGVFAYERFNYRYDSIGLFELRSWEKADVSGVAAWRWEFEAVRDLSADRVVVDVFPGPGCGPTSVAAFYPVRDEATHQPKITDISSMDHPNLRWAIDDLRDRDWVRFVLKVGGSGPVAQPPCLDRKITLEREK